MQTKTIEFLKRADQAYFDGSPIISDRDYDILKSNLQSENPNHPYFRTVGAEVRGGKVDLPYKMGSLDQIYDEDVQFWIKNYKLNGKDIIIADKLDGISVMLIYKNGTLSEAYSRGNGIQGADITRHMRHIPNLPKVISGHAYLAVRAELIMSNEVFKTRFEDEFSNARSMIAGCANRSDSYIEVFNNSSIVAYEIVETSGNMPKTKTEMLNTLSDLGFEVAFFVSANGSDVSTKYLKDHLFSRLSASSYELDGVVLTIDDIVGVPSLKSSSDLNPEFSVKFKAVDPNSVVIASVVAVHWEISKNGFFKPRVEITPVNLFGTVVTYATGFNAAFISENFIAPGAKVEITKSGSVIPYIMSVVENADEPSMPTSEPWEWNETGIEAVVLDPDNNKIVLFKRVLDLFETWQIDNLREKTLIELFDTYNLWGKPFLTAVQTIIDLIEIEFVNAVGQNGRKIYESLSRRMQAMKPEIFLGSFYQFGFGFGVRKAKAILSQIGGIDKFWNLTANDIAVLDGFSDKTAGNIYNGISVVKKFHDECVANGILNFEHVDKTDEMNGLVVVLTGFRDPEFQQKIENMGAKVASSVSKKTTHLICATIDSSSSKCKKAKELGVKVVTLSDFKDEYNL